MESFPASACVEQVVTPEDMKCILVHFQKKFQVER